MDHLYAKFGDCTLNRFSFIVRTDKQTESHTDADDRFTHATTIGVSNNQSRPITKSFCYNAYVF